MNRWRSRRIRGQRERTQGVRMKHRFIDASPASSRAAGTRDFVVVESLERLPRLGAPPPITLAVRCGGLLMPLLALTGCDPGILPSQGSVGKGNTTIMIDSLAIMLAIVVPTIAAILAFAWWFR